jgi:hypothetical protein
MTEMGYAPIHSYQTQHGNGGAYIGQPTDGITLGGVHRHSMPISSQMQQLAFSQPMYNPQMPYTASQDTASQATGFEVGNFSTVHHQASMSPTLDINNSYMDVGANGNSTQKHYPHPWIAPEAEMPLLDGSYPYGVSCEAMPQLSHTHSNSLPFHENILPMHAGLLGQFRTIGFPETLNYTNQRNLDDPLFRQETVDFEPPFDNSARPDQPSNIDLWNLPSNYATATNPLYPKQFEHLQQHLSAHPPSSPMPLPVQGLNRQDLPPDILSTKCNCGPGCSCLACVTHPFNQKTMNHISDLAQILEEDYQSFRDESRPRSFHSRHSSLSHISTQAITKPAPTSPDGSLPSPALSPPLDQDIKFPRTIDPSSDYFHLSYPVPGPCSDLSGTCRCGDDCQCIGCQTHGGHTEEPVFSDDGFRELNGNDRPQGDESGMLSGKFDPDKNEPSEHKPRASCCR